MILDWPARPGRPVAIRLHADTGGYALWIEDAGWFGIDLEASEIRLPSRGNQLRTEERLWGMPSLLMFMHRGDMPLHAGAVEIGGKAVLYTAPSKFGKTTLSAALWTAGHRLLSEDLSRVRLTSQTAVLPGPAMLRVRHDMAERLSISDAIRVGEDSDRVHFALEVDRRGDSHPVPIAGLVILREGDEPLLSRVDPATALKDLWVVTFHLPDRDAIAFSQLGQLVDTVPVWNLVRPLRLDALPSTITMIERVANEA
ncbi:MAG TPA: hypothetical protein VHL52_05870 [Acidimicrobiia bacterium]|nr:hypothetical protein [Acidimicrobiia bacterium]